MSFDCKTPALIENMTDQEFEELTGKKAKFKQQSVDNFKAINELLQRVNFYEKKERPDDNKQWIDKHSWEAIYQEQLRLHQATDFAMVEVQLPTFPHSVLYMDEMYDDLKGDFIYP